MQKEEIKKLFIDKGCAKMWQLVESKIKNSIRISLEKIDESTIQLGQSKIGGFPDLPDAMEWPEFNGNPLAFIAQFNLAEFKQLDLEKKLPETGILYFFYDVVEQRWGYDPEDKEYSKVLYFDGSNKKLKRKQKPLNLGEEFVFTACQLSFKSQIDLPDMYSSILWEDISMAEKINYLDESEGAIYKVYDILYPELPNKLLGHSNNLQDGMELQCELVTNGIYLGDFSGYDEPLVKELGKNVDNWNLLLQIGSNEEQCNMLWGDGGMIYFWIKGSDLKEKKFENTWLILQSS